MYHGRVALGPRSDWLDHKTAWTSRGRPMKGDQSKLSLERTLSEWPRDGCGWPVDVTGRPTDDFGRPMDVHLAPWTTTGWWSHYGCSTCTTCSHYLHKCLFFLYRYEQWTLRDAYLFSNVVDLLQKALLAHIC